MHRRNVRRTRCLLQPGSCLALPCGHAASPNGTIAKTMTLVQFGPAPEDFFVFVFEERNIPRGIYPVTQVGLMVGFKPSSLSEATRCSTHKNPSWCETVTVRYGHRYILESAWNILRMLITLKSACNNDRKGKRGKVPTRNWSFIWQQTENHTIYYQLRKQYI